MSSTILLLISSFLPFVDPSPVYEGEGGVKGEARIGNRCGGSAKQYVKFERTKRMETRAQTLNGGSHAG